MCMGVCMLNTYTHCSPTILFSDKLVYWVIGRWTKLLIMHVCMASLCANNLTYVILLNYIVYNEWKPINGRQGMMVPLFISVYCRCVPLWILSTIKYVYILYSLIMKCECMMSSKCTTMSTFIWCMLFFFYLMFMKLIWNNKL